MNEKELLHHLKKCTLFDAVKQNEIAGVLSSAGCIARSYGPGAIVAFRGDHYDKLLVILSGSVIAEFQDYQGKVLKVETLRQGEAIATAVLFSPDNYLPVTLTTDVETTIFEIPRNCILQLMKTSSAFMEQMLYDIGNRLTILAEKTVSHSVFYNKTEARRLFSRSIEQTGNGKSCSHGYKRNPR